MDEKRCWRIINRNGFEFAQNLPLDKAWKGVEALSKNGSAWTVQEQEIEGLTYLRRGIKKVTEDEWHIEWILFDTEDVPEDDDELLERIGFIAFNAGAGMQFAHKGFVRRLNKRVLVTQYCGVDI